MSSNSTFQSFSSSYTSSTINGKTTSRSEQTYSNPEGTHIHRSAQDPGQEPVREHVRLDARGNRIGEGGQNRIEDVTDKEEQQERDREYEERMEGEYAKREGGA